MRQIHPHALFLGHSGDARDFAALRRVGIRALVDLALNEAPIAPPRELVYCRFPILDGQGNDRDVLRAAIDTTAGLLRSRVLTLLSCSAGMSRSPAIAAASLASVTGQPATRWLELIASGGVDVSPGLWEDVLAAVQA